MLRATTRSVPADEPTAVAPRAAALPARPAEGLLERRGASVALLALTVFAALALRCWRLTERSIWFDESVCWRFLQFPPGEMLSRLTGEIYPPLYVILLRVWTGTFGESLLAMRGLSVLLAGVAAVGIHLFSCAAFAGSAGTGDASCDGRGRWIGAAAAALFAVSAFQVRLSWEIRMYSLGTALAVLSAWVLLRALFAPRPRWGPWAVYALLALSFAHTHYFALFSLAGQGLFASATCGRNPRGACGGCPATRGGGRPRWPTRR